MWKCSTIEPDATATLAVSPEAFENTSKLALWVSMKPGEIHIVRWAKEIRKQPAVQRGERVNKAWGPEEERVPERHYASDIS